MLATASFDGTAGVWKRWETFGQEDKILADGARTRDIENDGDDEDEGEEEEEWAYAVQLDGPDSEVKSVSWSPSGSLLAMCSRDKSIWIWEDLEDGDNNFETVAVLEEHSADVKSVAWHPNEDCLASGAYDDTIRLWREDIDDWGQVACLRGHQGTVWSLDWEAGDETKALVVPRGAPPGEKVSADRSATRRQQWLDTRTRCGPRIASCSDDKTVRIWRQQVRERNATSSSDTGVPSMIHTEGIDETWFEEHQLPDMHDLAVYSVAWSKRTGLLASAGADGRLVVYEERFTLSSSSSPSSSPASVEMHDADDNASPAVPNGSPTQQEQQQTPQKTEWRVVAVVEASHGIYEVNHVCWANRADRDRAATKTTSSDEPSMRDVQEEMLLSSGDDGTVKAWKVDELILTR